MRILCTAKDSHIFLTKNNSVFVILMFEILTKRLLTTSLVLNNWALFGNSNDRFWMVTFFAVVLMLYMFRGLLGLLSL